MEFLVSSASLLVVPFGNVFSFVFNFWGMFLIDKKVFNSSKRFSEIIQIPVDIVKSHVLFAIIWMIGWKGRTIITIQVCLWDVSLVLNLAIKIFQIFFQGKFYSLKAHAYYFTVFIYFQLYEQLNLVFLLILRFQT